MELKNKNTKYGSIPETQEFSETEQVSATSGEEHTQQAEPSRPSKEVMQLMSERQELNDRLLRSVAEFENYKKRAAKDLEDVRFQTKEKLLREFLPILDGLDRALEAAELSGQRTTSSSPDALIEGVRLVQKQFLAALARSDIHPLEAHGLPFDPQHHEAVQQIESSHLLPGTVAQVVRRGYVSGGRLLRPALVVVTKNSSKESIN